MTKKQNDRKKRNGNKKSSRLLVYRFFLVAEGGLEPPTSGL